MSRNHTLSDTELRDLGAGRPSPRTVAVLRQAQTGKHLLLLRDLLRRGDDQDRQSWYAEEHADPESFARRLADPMFGAWVTAAVRDHQAKKETQVTAAVRGHQAKRETGAAREIRAEHRGQTFRVRLEDRDPARALLGLDPTGRLSDNEVTHWQHCLDDAWRILVERHAPAARTLADVVTCLVPVHPDPAARGISATSVDAFGAVALSAPGDAVSLAVGLLHEAQHSLLNATTYLFDLLEQPHTLGYSPWRDDPRPASGILHGAYAYLAVTRFWRTEQDRDRLAMFEFARWREATATATAGLLRAPLTGPGVRFVNALHTEVTGWEQPVDPEVERLARAANRDHYLRWRLRNMRVERPGSPARLVPAPRRALEASDRLDLIHARMRDLSQPAASAGDAAFLRGDYETAAHAYAQRVSARPDDDAAWAGLAMTGHDEDRVEVAKAVVLATGGDPREVLDRLAKKPN